MAWMTPLYAKSKVDQAGRTIVNQSATLEETELALVVVNNWRASHSFPLNTFQNGLRKKARQVDSDALVAQRIKRLLSIHDKLNRFSGMKLSRMQDIGGCRAVVTTIEQVDNLVTLHRTSTMKHDLVNERDYLRNPKSSGYRGFHLIYKYFSDKSELYNGLQIEIQLRSRLQHAWATAVETVGTFSQQALKSSLGDEKWLRFFAVMASEMALREQTPSVPGTPTTTHEVRSELRTLAGELDVTARLTTYGQALRLVEQTASIQNSHYFLLELNATASTLSITGYRLNQLEIASQEYQAVERAIAGQPGCDAVLVSVESVAALRRAYPNYFLDTTAFVEAVQRAIK